MNIRTPASVACCTALLISTVPLTARAATKTLDLGDAEPQYAGKLCWAAADVLAVNQFYRSCPTSPPATPALFPTSQALEAANAWGTALATCVNNIGACNHWGTAALHGLTATHGFDGIDPAVGDNISGLTWNAAIAEINAGRPFLFQWTYPQDDTGNLPVGKHQLVAIGYSDEMDSSGTQYLRIWDPWPVPLLGPNNTDAPSVVSACGPAPGIVATPEHKRWVLFSVYTGPGNDMGAAVTPLHEEDQWHLVVPPDAPVLKVDAALPPPSGPAPSHGPPVPLSPEPLPQLSFARALAMALPESRRLDLQVSGTAPRSLGVPFPIVALGFVQLLHASDDPTGLLVGTTSAILFPVESKGKVVDAFLMLFKEGRWKPGGYANLEITQRLVAFRARYAREKQLKVERFYMVSVPGEVAFFAAYGKGKTATLIPAATDHSIGAVAGVATLADTQLRNLTTAIQLDLQAYPDRGREPVRPR